jgi:mono/diheme cytochrome c family protein
VAAPDLGERTCFVGWAGLAFPPMWSGTGCAVIGGTGLVPYTVNAPLFSDGAHKERWLGTPGPVTVEPDGSLTFPDGAVLLKRFSVEGQPLETRVMLMDGGAWRFASYVWNADGTDARLWDAEGETVDAPAGPWTLPAETACLACHGENAVVLGPHIQQLDREVCVDGQPIGQLDHLTGAGVLHGVLPDLVPLVDPADPTAPLDGRARSYLHANCAHCHRPGGWTPPAMDLDLRFSTSFADTRTCGVPIQYLGRPGDEELRLVPGNPGASHLYTRMADTGRLGQMPAAGGQVDPLGTEVVRAWITGIADCP